MVEAALKRGADTGTDCKGRRRGRRGRLNEVAGPYVASETRFN